MSFTFNAVKAANERMVKNVKCKATKNIKVYVIC